MHFMPLNWIIRKACEKAANRYRALLGNFHEQGMPWLITSTDVPHLAVVLASRTVLILAALYLQAALVIPSRCRSTLLEHLPDVR